MKKFLKNPKAKKLSVATDGFGLSWMVEYAKGIFRFPLGTFSLSDESPPAQAPSSRPPAPQLSSSSLPPVQSIGIDPGRRSIATAAYANFKSATLIPIFRKFLTNRRGGCFTKLSSAIRAACNNHPRHSRFEKRGYRWHPQAIRAHWLFLPHRPPLPYPTVESMHYLPAKKRTQSDEQWIKFSRGTSTFAPQSLHLSLARLRQTLGTERKSLKSRLDSCRKGFLALRGVRRHEMAYFPIGTFNEAMTKSRTSPYFALSSSPLQVEPDEVWNDILEKMSADNREKFDAIKVWMILCLCFSLILLQTERTLRQHCFVSYSGGKYHTKLQTSSDGRRAELRLSKFWKKYAEDHPDRWKGIKTYGTSNDKFGQEVPSIPGPTLKLNKFHEDFKHFLTFLLPPLAERMRDPQTLKMKFNRFIKVCPVRAQFAADFVETTLQS